MRICQCGKSEVNPIHICLEDGTPFISGNHKFKPAEIKISLSNEEKKELNAAEVFTNTVCQQLASSPKFNDLWKSADLLINKIIEMKTSAGLLGEQKCNCGRINCPNSEPALSSETKKLEIPCIESDPENQKYTFRKISSLKPTLSPSADETQTRTDS